MHLEPDRVVARDHRLREPVAVARLDLLERVGEPGPVPGVPLEGDGEVAAVPLRLGPWRDWVPTRGNLFGGPSATPPRIGELPRPRRRDPGE